MMNVHFWCGNSTPTIHTIPAIHAIHTKHTIDSKLTIHTIPTIHAKHTIHMKHTVHQIITYSPYPPRHILSYIHYTPLTHPAPHTTTPHGGRAQGDRTTPPPHHRGGGGGWNTGPYISNLLYIYMVIKGREPGIRQASAKICRLLLRPKRFHLSFPSSLSNFSPICWNEA